MTGIRDWGKSESSSWQNSIGKRRRDDPLDDPNYDPEDEENIDDGDRCAIPWHSHHPLKFDED